MDPKLIKGQDQLSDLNTLRHFCGEPWDLFDDLLRDYCATWGADIKETRNLAAERQEG